VELKSLTNSLLDFGSFSFNQTNVELK